MNPTRPYIAFEGDRCIASGELARCRPRGEGALDRRKDARSSSSTPTPATRSISIFAAPSTTCWRDCRELSEVPGAADRSGTAGAARSRPAETGRGRARSHAAAAALGLAGAATGRRFGRLAQAGRRGAARRRATRIESARPGKRPIVSCRRWPATGRISKTRSVRCSPIEAARFEQIDRRMAR